MPAIMFRKMAYLKMGMRPERSGEMTSLSWTGERYLPWWEDPVTAYEHWHRYAYATQFVSGKTILDLASGEGYGSASLATTARRVIALDIDENAVKHARRKYRSVNLHFIAGSILEMPLFRIGFDVIVCFEAIEHISDPEKLLTGVKQLLVPGGLFLVSTPNKPEYKKTEPSNPFHVKELDFEEFHKMLARHFKRTQFLGQRVYCNSSLWPMPPGTSGMISEYLLDRNEDEFVLAGADKRVPLYFVGIASDAEDLPNITGAVLVDSSNSLLKEAARIQDETAADVQSLKEAIAWRESQLRQMQESIHEQEQALAWREDQLKQTQESIHEREQALAWKDTQLRQTQETIRGQEQALAWKDTQLQQIQETIRGQEQAIAWKEDQLHQAQTALAWIENQLQQTQAAIHSQEQAIAWKEGQLHQAQTALAWIETQLQQAQATISSHEQALAWRESQVNEFTSKIQILQSEYERSAAELSAIKSGRIWRFIQKILKIRNRLFPSGSRRRASYDRWTGR
jgi:SAM-dependent methyltransferase